MSSHARSRNFKPLIAAAAALALLAVFVSGSWPTHAQDATYMPKFTSEQTLKIPAGKIWREWPYVGSLVNFGMGDDSREGFRQKNKNLVCRVTGGPCKVISRPAAVVHGGLGIRASEFDIVVNHLVDTLNKFKVPKKEQQELPTIIGTLRPDIVEVEDK